MLKKFILSLLVCGVVSNLLPALANEFAPSIRYYNKLKTCTEYNEDRGPVQVGDTVMPITYSIYGIGEKGTGVGSGSKYISAEGKCAIREDHAFYGVSCVLPMEVAKKYAQAGINMHRAKKSSSVYINKIHSNTNYCFKQKSNF